MSTSRVVSVMLWAHSRSSSERDRLAVDADVGDASARRDDLLADVERRRDADGLDRHVHAGPCRQLHHLVDGPAVRAVDELGGAEGAREAEPARVHVDHHHLGRRVELRGEQGREADRARSHDRDGVAGLHLTVQHAALEAGREDVAQHHERVFVGSVRQLVEAGVGVRDAHELRLGTVDRVAEVPAAAPAVRVHPLLAEVALAAGGDARDQDAVAALEARHGGARLLDHADALVAEDASVADGRHVALQDVQVGPADGGRRDADHGVGRLSDGGSWHVLPRATAGPVVDERLHPGLRRSRLGKSQNRFTLFHGFISSFGWTARDGARASCLKRSRRHARHKLKNSGQPPRSVKRRPQRLRASTLAVGRPCGARGGFGAATGDFREARELLCLRVNGIKLERERRARKAKRSR